MPELPEVETVCKGLNRLVREKTIQSVEVLYPNMIRTGAEGFRKKLANQTIHLVERRGKYLIFNLSRNVFISHLRMEGKYLFYTDTVDYNKHFHVIFHFTDGSHLVYQDVRKFGTMELLDSEQVESYFSSKKLGPEPTKNDFLLEPFQIALQKSKKVLKPYLLDQTAVVGLGNIYVDESLWHACIHPARLANSLKENEIECLHDSIIYILQLGIQKGGSTIRTYRNALGEDGTMQEFLSVYGKTGEPCPRCQALIEKIKLAGRGTHFCPSCQVL